MNFKSKPFKRFVFYLGTLIFIISLILVKKIPFMATISGIGLVLMCCYYPVNDIKRHKFIK